MNNYNKIKCFALINRIDTDKVEELKKSFLNNGWNGEPILYCELGLITGSHRLNALRELEMEMEMGNNEELFDIIFDLLENVEAIDVTDIVNDYCGENDISYSQIDFSSLSPLFEGTEIEKYKEYISEW